MFNSANSLLSVYDVPAASRGPPKTSPIGAPKITRRLLPPEGPRAFSFPFLRPRLRLFLGHDGPLLFSGEEGARGQEQANQVEICSALPYTVVQTHRATTFLRKFCVKKRSSHQSTSSRFPLFSALCECTLSIKFEASRHACNTHPFGHYSSRVTKIVTLVPAVVRGRTVD